MAPAVRSLFSSRLDSFFDANITSRGVLATICDSLHKYNLFHYLELWFRESIFPTYSNWKTIVKAKILEKEADDWFRFCSDHPSMRVAQTCLENISPYQFWSIADRYRDLVDKTHGKLWIEWQCFLAYKYWGANFVFFAKTLLKMSAIFSRIAPVLEIILNLSGQT